VTNSATKTAAQKQAEALAKMRRKLEAKRIATGVTTSPRLVVPTGGHSADNDWASLFPEDAVSTENEGGVASTSPRRAALSVKERAAQLVRGIYGFVEGPMPGFFDPRHANFEWFDYHYGDHPWQIALDPLNQHRSLWDAGRVTDILRGSKAVLTEVLQMKRNGWRSNYLRFLKPTILSELFDNYFPTLEQLHQQWEVGITNYIQEKLNWWDKAYGGKENAPSLSMHADLWCESLDYHEHMEYQVDFITKAIPADCFGEDGDIHISVPYCDYSILKDRSRIEASWRQHETHLAYWCLVDFNKNNELYWGLLSETVEPIVVPSLTPAEVAEITGEPVATVTGSIPVTVKRKIDPAKKLMAALLRKRAELDAKLGR